MGTSVAGTVTKRNTKKRCTGCGGQGPFGMNKDRHGTSRLKSRCKKCLSGAQSARYNADLVAERARARVHSATARQKRGTKGNRKRWNAYRAAKPEQYDGSHRRWHRAHPLTGMLIAAKSRAKKRGLVFEIDTADIEMPAVCPLLGLTLVRSSTGKMCPTSPSLDRKDSAKGYIPGNVWVISWRANWLKNNATLAELELLTANLRGALSP